MKMLNVRFSETQKLKIDDLSGVVNIDSSKIARAAMKLGMELLVIAASKDINEATKKILINDALAK
jgi:hypothetical protein